MSTRLRLTYARAVPSVLQQAGLTTVDDVAPLSFAQLSDQFGVETAVGVALLVDSVGGTLAGRSLMRIRVGERDLSLGEAWARWRSHPETTRDHWLNFESFARRVITTVGERAFGETATVLSAADVHEALGGGGGVPSAEWIVGRLQPDGLIASGAFDPSTHTKRPKVGSRARQVKPFRGPRLGVEVSCAGLLNTDILERVNYPYGNFVDMAEHVLGATITAHTWFKRDRGDWGTEALRGGLLRLYVLRGDGSEAVREFEIVADDRGLFIATFPETGPHKTFRI